MLFNESDAMFAWWLVVAFLFPLLILAIKTHSKVLITICSISLATQAITTPSFYIFKEDFHWGHVKPFGFDFTDALPILIKVSLYITGLILFYIVLRFALFRKKSLSTNTSSRLNLRANPEKSDASIIKSSSNSKLRGEGLGHGVAIFSVVILMIPLHAWMFLMGISIVGVDPPNLPYSLSGVLHYFTKYIIPLLLGYLYWKSKQSSKLAIFLLLYAWILGMSSLSRSALVTVMLPVLALAWIRRRHILLSVVGLGSIIGFSAVTNARGIVHFVSDGKTGAFTDMGLITLVGNIFDGEIEVIIGSEVILKTFIGVFDRIEGFRNLVMAHWYDPNQVIGSLGFVLRLLNRSFSSWDQDLHHMQWQGNVLPEGFVNGGALLSTAVILGNDALYWILLASMFSAITLLLLEISTMLFVRKYGLPDTLGTAAIVFLCVIYFIESGGSGVFFYPFIILLTFGHLPKLSIINSWPKLL